MGQPMRKHEVACLEKAGEVSRSRGERGWDGSYPPRSDFSSYSFLVPGQKLRKLFCASLEKRRNTWMKDIFQGLHFTFRNSLSLYLLPIFVTGGRRTGFISSL